MPPPVPFDVRLVSSRTLSPSVRELDFERADGLAFEFQAGQWISLVLPLPEGEGRRAYSIASAPDGSPRFSLAITKVAGGAGSTFLHALATGASLRAIGPQGFFTRPLGERQPTLFVGTGTGITPLRSMILDALAHGDDSPLTLVCGVRDEADRLYQAELGELAKRHANLRVEYTLSRPSPSWTGLTGYVQTHVEALFAELVSKGPEPAHIYICGLERMVGAVRDLARKHMGVGRKLVHSERYD